MIDRLRRAMNAPGLGGTLTRAVAGSAGVRLVGLAFGFLVGVQLARGLGAEGYGIYGVAMSVIALLTVIPEFGIGPLVTREVAAASARQDWSRLRGVFHWSFRTVLGLSASVALLTAAWLIVTQAAEERLFGPLVIGVTLIPFGALVRLCAAGLRGLHEAVLSQLPELLRPVFFSLLLLASTFAKGSRIDPSIAMALQVLAAVAALGVAAPLLRGKLPEPALTAPVSAIPGLWRSAFPMALTEGARVLEGHLVMLLLGLMTQPGVAGTYRVASSVYLLVLTPVSLLNVVVMSFIAKLHAERDVLRLQRLLRWVAVAMTSGVAAISAPFVFVGKWLLGVTFGIEFSASNAPLLVMCLGATLSAAFGANAALLNMTGHERSVTRAFLAGVLVLALVSGPLIHYAGSVGAAWATVCSSLAWNIATWRDAKRSLGLDTSLVSVFAKKGAG